jgi:hypothetical protein
MATIDAFLCHNEVNCVNASQHGGWGTRSDAVLKKTRKLAHIVFPIPVRSAIEYSNTNQEGDMNARNITMTKTSFALTSLAVFGAFAIFAGACSSSSDDNGGTGGGGGHATGPAGGNTSGGGGGVASSGGSPAAGGGNTVTFSAGAAVGPMTGWGWIALGSLDTATSPTCGGTPITNAAPCMTSTSWEATDSLCITGSIPALPASPVQADYDANWGLQIGVNANADDTIAIGQTFSTIAVTLTGSPLTGLRVELHRQGDPAATTYCANNTGSAMKLTSFNTACWDGSGTAFTAADAPNIDKVGIQVSSTAAAITVTDLCWTQIVFGN